MNTYAYDNRALSTAAMTPVGEAHQTNEGSLLEILFRPFRRAQVTNELRRLDGRMLSDIGISRSDIDRIAASSVEGKGEWLIVSLVKYAFGKFTAWRLRQESYRTLSGLDDRTLADIGIERAEIPTLVRVMHDRYQSPSVDGAFDIDVVRPLSQWRLWQVAHKQLGRLDNRTLSDIGPVRADMTWVADELASRAAAKPANANRIAPKAA